MDERPTSRKEATMPITFETSGSSKTPDDVASALTSLATLDMEHFHKTAGKILVGSIRKGVQQSGKDVRGNPFKALAASTQQSARPRPKPGAKKISQRVRGPGHILEDTNSGKMLKALTFRADANEAVVYFEQGYGLLAKWHNEGTKGPYPIRAKHGKSLRLPLVTGVMQSPKKTK